MATDDQNGWSPTPIAIASALGTGVAGVATPLVGLPWYTPAGAMVFIAVLASIAGYAMSLSGRLSGWRLIHTFVSLSGAGVFSSYTARLGWSPIAVVVLIVAAVGLTVVSYAVPVPNPNAVIVEDPRDRRPEDIRSWEAVLQRIYGRTLSVRDVVAWENPDDGEDVYATLDESGDKCVDDLADRKSLQRIAGARRLLQGCTVEVSDGDHQGEVRFSVMLRNTFAEDITLGESTTAASIDEPFTVMNDARGRPVDICLRIDTLIIGGATGSGKTTLLDRLMMFGERCPNALQWVVDLNGGGLATKHVEPFAQGLCPTPGIDWSAGDPSEAVAMTGVATAVIKDRKTSHEARSRQVRGVVKVDRDLPLLLVYGDEMAELMKGRGVKAIVLSTVNDNVKSLVEIGRAAGGRAVMSVLRGTSDTQDRAIKVQAALRIALKSTEQCEYSHVLGVEPGRTRLTKTGQGWVLRGDDPRPFIARTMDIPDGAVRQHVIATSHHRTTLDRRGREVAASMRRLEDFFPENTITSELRRSQLARDIEAGMVYENRWNRAEAMLAELRGEEAPVSVQLSAPARPVEDASLDEFMRLAGVTDEKPGAQQAIRPTTPTSVPEADVNAAFGELTSDEHFVAREAPDPEVRRAPDQEPAERPVASGSTTRERVVRYLAEAHPRGLTNGQIDAMLTADGASVSPQRRDQVVKALEERGVVSRRPGLVWVLVKS
jgi:hypothetical protein